MAELATIARPYAEALYQAARSDATALKGQVDGLAAAATHPALRQYADNPKTAPDQVRDVVVGVLGALDPRIDNLLRAVVENGRLAALPEIAAQFQALVNASSGISDAVVESAFPIAPEQLADVTAALERRFGRRLNPRVALVPELIGGIRVIVGDEVLDTSVKARLERMKLALTA